VAKPALKPAPAAPVASKPAAAAKPAPTPAPAASKTSSKSTAKPSSKVAPAPPAPKPEPPKREIGVRAGYVKPSKPRPDRVKLAVARQRVVLPAGYKPKSDEEYMGPYQLEYFRQRLLQWKGDLIEESKQTIENLKEEVRDVGDEAERATRETENSLELRTRDRYRKLINKIDSTLKRIDDGSYGYCVDTGDEIGLERMEARLTAERTLDAQERWEHMQKQMGD
jgi:DnaK suppressor protein